MKWSLPILTLLAVGCTKDNAPDNNSRASDNIGFNVSSTRATSASSSTIRDDSFGFRVWATSTDAPSDWYDDGTSPIDGTNNYIHADGKWGFRSTVKWPQSGGYPMRFYAIYPAAPLGMGDIVEGFSTGATLSAEYTVQSTADRQTDLLAASATTNVKPATGTVSLAFRHILSQIDFAVIAGAGVEVEVQSIDIENVATTRTYDFIAGEWMAPTTGNVSYSYFGITDDNAPSWPGTASVIADDLTPNPIYTGSDAADKHLMLMPQTSPSWVPVSGTAPTAASGTYISVIYRMSNGAKGEVGFTDASQHPDNAGGVTGPLFVKAGFPLPADSNGEFVWIPGKSYTYHLGLGTYDSCNGYILDQYYYDSDGIRTNLPLVEVRDEGKLVGDKLQDGIPRISVAIDDWIVSTTELVHPSPRVTPSQLRLPLTAQTPARESISVTIPGGVEGVQWTLTSSAPSWLLLSLSSDGSGAAETVSGTGAATIYLVSRMNDSGVLRQAHIYLDGIASNVVVTVGQNLNVEAIADAGYIPTATYTTYVGAFWKHNEIGERVIRINVGAVAANRGAWTARVMWMDSRWGADDGVVLSPGGSPAITVGTANLTEYDANAENFPVVNGSDVVSGTTSSTSREIAFRIGLKSTYMPTTAYPARYAIVQISYGTRTQKIFLRQGEYDDYLMSPDDPLSGNPRTKAKKVSPYNLTAATLNAATDVSGTFPAVNPGRFTAYPTQAGAMFHWASESNNGNRRRWAWAPVGGVTGWDTGYPQSYWEPFAGAQENCPPGYRRPTDGSTSAAESNTTISNSEIRQSLWSQPGTGYSSFDKVNSAWGYYADGFFDRRPIVSSTNGTARSAVLPTSNDVAYAGCLFFNPVTGSDHYNASLFLPGAGYRTTGGSISVTGQAGHYHTSSAYSASAAWVLWIRYDGFARSGNIYKQEGRSIRCVRDTP